MSQVLRNSSSNDICFMHYCFSMVHVENLCLSDILHWPYSLCECTTLGIADQPNSTPEPLIELQPHTLVREATYVPRSNCSYIGIFLRQINQFNVAYSNHYDNCISGSDYHGSGRSSRRAFVFLISC